MHAYGSLISKDVEPDCSVNIRSYVTAMLGKLIACSISCSWDAMSVIDYHMSVVMSMSVCLCVCLSVNISPELHIRSSPFLRMLPVTVSSSGGAAIRYVFPVLWMTSFYTKRPEQSTQKGVGLYTQSDLTRPGHGGFDTAV